MSSPLLISYVLLWIVTIVLCVGFIGLARQIALLYERLPQQGARIEDTGPPVGSSISRFEETTIFGESVIIPTHDKSYTLLLFVSPSCSSCERTIEAVRALELTEKQLRIVLVSFIGNVEDNRRFLEKHQIMHIPLVLSWALSDQFKVLAAPYAVMIDGEGGVRAKGVANTRQHLDSLLNAVELGVYSMEEYSRSVS